MNIEAIIAGYGNCLGMFLFDGHTHELNRRPNGTIRVRCTSDAHDTRWYDIDKLVDDRGYPLRADFRKAVAQAVETLT